MEAAQTFLDELTGKQATIESYSKLSAFKSCEFTWDEGIEKLEEAIEYNTSEQDSAETTITKISTKIIQLETSVTSEQLVKLKEEKTDLEKQQAVLAAVTGDPEEVTKIKEGIMDTKSALMVAESKIAHEMTCPTCHTDLTETRQELNAVVQKEIDSIEERLTNFKSQLKTKLEELKASRTEQEVALSQEYNKKIRKITTVTDALELSRKQAIETLATERVQLVSQVNELRETRSALDTIAATQDKVVALIKDLAGYKVVVDKIVYPWIVSWGQEVPEAIDQKKISNANNDVVYCNGVATKLEAKKEELSKIGSDITTAEAKLITVQQELEALTDMTDVIASTLVDIQTYKDQLKPLNEDLSAKSVLVNESRTQLELERQEIDVHKKAVAEIKVDIKGVNDKLLGSAENNALHRAVADARGVVVENVWNTLFTATNECFSQIRGEVSDITRDGKVFRVNGTKTVRLSGSTLDSLGLAMRAAIRDIFAPATSFLLLDEIAAGADPERTAAMMAQVACLNVGQKILVTHETISDGIADNIIEV